MNNIPQKNVILKLRHTSDMPYKSIEYVNQYSECANITHADINNSMRQLLENDLYIENELNTTSSYIIGPKTNSNLDEKPNGYKTYGNLAASETLEILHKVDKPLSGTIQRLQEGDTRFVTVWSDILFVGREGSRLQYALSSGAGDFQTLPVIAYGFYQDGDRILFAAKDGAYQLSSYTEDDEKSENYGKTLYGVVRLNSNTLNGLRSIHLNKNTWQVTAGGETCVYQGSYDPKKSLAEQKQGIKFETQLLFDEDDEVVSETVNAIGSNGRVTVVGTNSGVFQPGGATVLRDAQNIYQYNGGAKVEKNYSVVAGFDGNVYAGAENGLFRVSGNVMSRPGLVGGDITDQVVDIKIKNDVMYVATPSGVYSVSKTLVRSGNYLQIALPDNRIPSSATVRKILIANSQVYVGTSAGLYCFIPDDVVYINEICTTGEARSLPAGDTSNRFGDIHDICVKNGQVIIGTSTGLVRLESNGTREFKTKIVKQFDTYSDVRGHKIDSGRIIKILQDSSLDEAYVITPGGVCNSFDLEKQWVPSTEGETIADAAFADIDGVKRIVVATNANTYVLSLGSVPFKIAQPLTPVPGVAVAASSNAVVVAGPDGKCRYTHNSLDKISNMPFQEIECGIQQLESFAGNVYGVRTDKKANMLQASAQPSRKNIYVDQETASYAWSTVQNGYLFVRGNRLIFKGLAHEYGYEPGATGDEKELLYVNVLDDVSTWYAGSDVTFVCVDDTHNTAYIGTTSTVLSAALADGSGSKISSPTFTECACDPTHTFGRVNCICKGYTGSSQAYSYGSYTILKPISPQPMDPELPTHSEVAVNVSENESILVASQNGLFELKAGGSQFTLLSPTEYVAIAATPKLFVGITASSHKIHTCANEFTQSQDTDASGIKPGTESDPVTYTKYTVSSFFAPREHAQAASNACSICVFDDGSNHVIYAAGGVGPVIKNTVGNSSLASFQFSPTSYGYVQSTVNVKAVQPPEDRPVTTYAFEEHICTDTYQTSSGEMAQRKISQSVGLTYIPISYILTGFDGYNDYVLYATNGIYTVDGSNIALAESILTAASGAAIAKAARMLAAQNMLFIICGSGEGIQTVGHEITRTGFVVDGMEFADGNYYFKTATEWRYMSQSQFSASAAASTVDTATSLASVFQSAGVPPAEYVTFKLGTDGTAYAGTSTKGLKRVSYFTSEVPAHAAATVPAIFSGFNIYTLNPASKSNNVMAVRRLPSGKYEICDYNLVTNTASISEYQIQRGVIQPISQFNRVAFANQDGSAAIYIADEYGSLYYTKTATFKESPAVGSETFYDMAYIYTGSDTFMARAGKVFRFAEIGAGTAWTRMSETGAVRSMCDISGGKCLIATSSGLWYYDEIELVDETIDPETGEPVPYRWYEGECVWLREVTNGIDDIRMYTYDGKERYIYTSGQNMLSSANYKLWKPVLSWQRTASGQQTGIASINSIYRMNDRTYFAGANNGTYMTKYDYDMIQDTKSFTKDQALSVYDQLFQTVISAKISTLLSNHVSADPGDHSENAIITQINKHYLNVNLDNITDWSSSVLCNDTDGYVNVTNDIVSEMYFGEYADGDVMVNVSSFLTPDGPVLQDGVTYIMKRWSSGVTELYVNVPTTSSYYIANCFGASNCKHDQADAYFRKNLEQFGSDIASQDSTLSTHWTSLSVGVASASYHIDNLLDVQINGMSLPLAVYKDLSANGDTGAAGKMYRSYIEPSLTRKYDISKTDDDGNYIFEFACFGTDAQAIKLMFYDEKSRIAADCVKVVFDANGGEGKMPNQKFIITPDVNGKTILEQKNLRKCSFTNMSSGHTKVFAGWSILPLADNSNATYEDKTAFPQYKSGQTFEDLMGELGDATRTDPLKKNEQIRLYAVWLDYQFSDTDTTLMMASDRSEFFIDSVGVDTSTRLKDKVIINFGD